MFRIFPTLLLLAAVLVLAGCRTAQERAEDHYRSALSLIAAQDMDRAAVELRSGLRLDPTHPGARETFAELLLARGDLRGGYSQYLQLIEHHPETVTARLVLAELAIAAGDWEEAARHGRAAAEADPESPRARAVAAALDYRAAALAGEGNEAARAAAVAAARAALDRDGALQIARRILIDDALNGPEPRRALALIDEALAQEPASREFHAARLNLLAGMGDARGAEAQLRRMAELFPQDQELQRRLIGWLLDRGRPAEAEAHLRARAAEAPPDDPAPHLALVDFVRVTRGAAAAQAELGALIDAIPGEGATPEARATRDLYGALHAALEFEAGRSDAAIAALRAILDGAEPSDGSRGIAVSLARMLQATGRSDEAAALVDRVLAEDPAQAEALRLQAARLIDEDRPGEAISALRRALDQDPRNAETLLLMATAHERDGSRDLARERLARAVEVSGSGPTEALRYAAFLSAEDRADAADRVLAEALRRAPDDLSLLAALAELRIGAGDWAGARQAIEGLRARPGAAARRLADAAQAELMLRQDRTDETVAFLQGVIDRGEGGAAEVATVLRALVAQDRTAEARAYLDARLALAPQDRALRMLDATLHRQAGDAAAAETVLRGLLAEDPGAEAPVAALYGLLRAEGRTGEATALLDAALATGTTSTRLRWLRAGAHEAAGEIDAAIALYEAAYATDAADPVIANNLASLIATHRDDAESLERAFAIARRLRGSQVPAFQDTYGWIEYRRGNLDEALAHLGPAAAGLPRDPLVRYHLGMTQAALGRLPEARATLAEALALAGDSPLPQFETARRTLADLPPDG